MQDGLHEPQRPDHHDVGPVLSGDELFGAADLGLREHFGYGGYLPAAKPAACRAGRYLHRRIAADALHLAGRGIGLHQQPAVLLDEPHRRGHTCAVACSW